MTKWKLTWWFLDALEGIKRGTDIIEADEMDEDIADELLSNEMWSNDDVIYNPKTLIFSKNAFSPKPVNWGILNIKKID